MVRELFQEAVSLLNEIPVKTFLECRSKAQAGAYLDTIFSAFQKLEEEKSKLAELVVELKEKLERYEPEVVESSDEPS